MDTVVSKKEMPEKTLITIDDVRTQMSTLMSRMQLANAASLQFEGNRDLYAVFGYKREITPEQRLAKYNRQDIASRIIDAPPNATWSNPPKMEQETVDDGKETTQTEKAESDTDLTKAWKKLSKKSKLWGAMHRADKLARLNPFSLLLFGFGGSGAMETPVRKANELLYVRAISSRLVDEIVFNDDPQNERYGLPESYKIRFDDPKDKKISKGNVAVTTTKVLNVHASRVVHVVEAPLEDLIYGTPIIEKVFNLLDDLLKVAGGTSEMYWLTGNRGLHADIDKEMDIDPADAAALSDEIAEYQHQLRRMVRTRGVKLSVLESSVPNPKETYEMIMSMISGTTGIPRRILVGSEAGQLASEQDRANWAERIEERRTLFVNPTILDPTVELMQRVALLPEGEWEWDWPSAFLQNPLEEGQTMAQIARSVGNLSRQTGASTPMQILTEEECREVLGFDGVIDKTDKFELAEYQKEAAVAKSASGGGSKPETDAAAAARAEKKADNAVADRVA
jgi:hypothetical protein